VAKYDRRKINSLLKDAGIVRNKLKVEGAVQNAKAFLQVRNEFGTFDKYIWSFVNGKPIRNKFKSPKELPARTELSDKISEDLKKRGFKFVGSTIVYAHMQATGMVNDHIAGCFRNKEVKSGL
jgi:DNA-3-methyladenine glycosylase I